MAPNGKTRLGSEKNTAVNKKSAVTIPPIDAFFPRKNCNLQSSEGFFFFFRKAKSLSKLT